MPELITEYVHFPNSKGGFMDMANYRNRVLNPLAAKLEITKVQLSKFVPHYGHTRTQNGPGEGYPGALAAFEGRYYGQRVHADIACKRQVAGGFGLCDAGGNTKFK